ncbi:hypothetical protein LG322_11925 [Microbacterium aerolatum]|uniref:glycosyltransferase n=1 Tax=Microbacterium aerolatum TaxID=153731 RepID=UPI00384DD877
MADSERRVSLVIGPLNVASQASSWSRSTRDSLGVSSTTVAFDGPLARRLKRDAVSVDDRAARSVPHYLLAPTWMRAMTVRSVLRHTSHFLSEGNTPLLADPRASRFTDEADWFEARGVSVGVVFHGSDARDPDLSMQIDEHSFFHHVPTEMVERLRRISRINRETVAAREMPVFVTTPDMLDHVPQAQLLPLTVDTSAWIGAPEILSTSDRPRVLHRPGAGDPMIKGSDRIVPVLEEFEAKGWIDVVRSPLVNHARMSELYARSDIVVDQLRIGSYGVTGVEAMAAGRIVVANVGSEAGARSDEEQFIVHADPSTFRTVLEELIMDPDRGRSIGAAGQRYAQMQHGGERAATVLRGFLHE